MERSSCFSVQPIYPCTAVTFCLLILPDEGLSFKAETSRMKNNFGWWWRILSCYYYYCYWREEITRGRIIEKEEKSQNTREAVKIKERKKSVSRLGIEPRTTVYAPPRSDHWAIETKRWPRHSTLVFISLPTASPLPDSPVRESCLATRIP